MDLIDPFGRTIRDLRISVTDRCNFRCTYCMPEEGMQWLPRDELLSYEEIARIASTRSRRDSPMPTRIPVVNGIASSPAASMVASRTAASLSGERQCGPPRRRLGHLGRLDRCADG